MQLFLCNTKSEKGKSFLHTYMERDTEQDPVSASHTWPNDVCMSPDGDKLQRALLLSSPARLPTPTDSHTTNISTLTLRQAGVCTFFAIVIVVIIIIIQPNRLGMLILLIFLNDPVDSVLSKDCGRQLTPTSSVLIRIPKSLDKLNLITSVKLETVTVPVKLRGSVSTPLLLWIYSL